MGQICHFGIWLCSATLHKLSKLCPKTAVESSRSTLLLLRSMTMNTVCSKCNKGYCFVAIFHILQYVIVRGTIWRVKYICLVIFFDRCTFSMIHWISAAFNKLLDGEHVSVGCAYVRKYLTIQLFTLLSNTYIAIWNVLHFSAWKIH